MFECWVTTLGNGYYLSLKVAKYHLSCFAKTLHSSVSDYPTLQSQEAIGAFEFIDELLSLATCKNESCSLYPKKHKYWSPHRKYRLPKDLAWHWNFPPPSPREVRQNIWMWSNALNGFFCLLKRISTTMHCFSLKTSTGRNHTVSQTMLLLIGRAI